MTCIKKAELLTAARIAEAVARSGGVRTEDRRTFITCGEKGFSISAHSPGISFDQRWSEAPLEEFYLNSKQLISALASMPNGEVQVSTEAFPKEELDEDLEAVKFLISSGGAVQKLVARRGESDVVWTTSPFAAFENEPGMIQRNLEQALRAACRDDSRYSLYGLAVRVKSGWWRLESTDGHRIARRRFFTGPCKAESDFFIPRCGADLALRFLQGRKKSTRVSVGHNEGVFMLRSNGASLRVLTKDLEGWPDEGVKYVLDKDFSGPSFSVSAEDLRTAMAQAKKANTMTIFEHEAGAAAMKVSAVNRDGPSFEAQVPLRKNGSAFKFALNADYVMDALHGGGKTDLFQFHTNGEDHADNPVLITNADNPGSIGLIGTIRLPASMS